MKLRDLKKEMEIVKGYNISWSEFFAGLILPDEKFFSDEYRRRVDGFYHQKRTVENDK